MCIRDRGSTPSRPISHSGAVGARPIDPASGGSDGTLFSVGKISCGVSFGELAALARKAGGMKGSAIGVMAAGCLAVGFGAGFALRPVISPIAVSPAVAGGVAQPSEEEATAVVRRHRLFTGTSLERATLKLGDCSPGGIGPGVTCMTQLLSLIHI